MLAAYVGIDDVVIDLRCRENGFCLNLFDNHSRLTSLARAFVAGDSVSDANIGHESGLPI